MTDNQLFLASATVTADANGHDIWALWADVNGWPSWNDGLESARLPGSFREGNEFTLTLAGGQVVEPVLTEVSQGEGFADQTTLPFGVLYTTHHIEKIGRLVAVTHELRAEVDTGQVEFFVAKLWPQMQRGVPESLANLVEIAAN
jgi:hypothetical protein